MLQSLTSASIMFLTCKTCKIYNSLLYEQDNPKYARHLTVANVFICFNFNNTYQIRLLKTGCRVIKLLG